MATIHDVAKQAGVSPATVSRVLNNGEIVSEETRNRVNQAIENLGYIPNHFSQNLRKQESKMLLVIIPDFKNPYIAAVLKGMDEAATSLGYQLLVTPTYMKVDRERKILKLLSNKRVDGVIFAAPVIDQEEMQRLSKNHPAVQCCEYIPGLKVSHVSINNFSAVYQVMSYFINKGHKRIALLSVENKNVSTLEREAAYFKALEDFGLEVDNYLVRRGDDYTFENGIALTQELLITSNPPTAVIGLSDSLACGCMRALSEAGISVPDQVEIMGFDNIYIADMVNPPLSTVAQPMQAIGKTAVNILVSQILGKNDFQEVFLDHEIILRKTTK